MRRFRSLTRAGRLLARPMGYVRRGSWFYSPAGVPMCEGTLRLAQIMRELGYLEGRKLTHRGVERIKAQHPRTFERELQRLELGS